MFTKTIAVLVAASAAWAADPVTLQIKSGEVAAHVSPMLYGLMTEEINFSYDGGLYAELVRNRSFKDDAKEAVHWSLVQDGGGAASMALDPATPLNDAIGTSLKLTVTKAPAGIANEGYWGIPVQPGTKYRASFYAKAAAGFTGPLTVAIVGNDGTTKVASAQVAKVSDAWHKYEVVLTAAPGAKASAANKLVITAGKPGTIWLSMVSLFPPTENNRANGNRRDIMKLLADMKPAFLRFPGGNYLEGNTIATRFDWKKTLGDIAQRPGHLNDAWRYWSSDGMGLLEFLLWCEDLHMQPVLGVYAGYSLRGERVAPGAALEPYVKDALDEIEYVMGDAKSTTWGARRAKDGHAAPFKLEFVEIGNEDNFDRQAGSYDSRFAQFFDAIKAKYPALKVITTAKVGSRTPDVVDEHYYRRSEDEMASHAHDYDTRPRTGPKIFVGEWATRVGEPTPNMSAALGDAAWMTGMERNSDIVIMSSYAPLFVNVNPGGMQWKTDLIGYDAMNSYGSPAYWAQQMFSAHHGDIVLPVTAQGIPTKTWQPPPPRTQAGQPAPPAPAVQQVPTVFYSATRGAGNVYLKIVNRAAEAQDVRVEISGVSVDAKGQSIQLAAKSPDDTNSIADPAKLVPVTASVDGLGAKFTRTFPPYSITVLVLKAK
ncbi:MAG: Alpha-N-arabinofuranosidase [Candidatus Solibacter sp.]|nr:Alpha-N-arabinofuranosidase [Candidatus Solibacter sp.]